MGGFRRAGAMLKCFNQFFMWEYSLTCHGQLANLFLPAFPSFYTVGSIKRKTKASSIVENVPAFF